MLLGQSLAFYEDFGFIAGLAVAAGLRSFRSQPEHWSEPKGIFVCSRCLWAGTFLTSVAAFITTLGLSSRYEIAFLHVAEVNMASWALVFITTPCGLLLDLFSWAAGWRPFTQRSFAVFLIATVGFVGMVMLYMQAHK